MRKVILYMQISLDGVVSDVDQWMTLSDEIVEDALESYNSVDTIVVGGNTYLSMAEYWQSAEKSSNSALERSVAQRINAMKKVVISRSKINNLVWNNSQQLLMDDSDSFVREIENLKNSEGKNISVESGVKTWQLFLQNSLFDELWLFVHPVVAGQGEKLFTDVGTKFSLQLNNSKIYKNGVVGLHYQKI
ncbi:dihydrofolate reductase family protein [Cohnella silvisoli]|uniref:Dihydrofolate reductase family protein n=1 Tax=Cohnella silvisoli TaxID=2873699 RepID=A0ABV1L1A7_9BACL|nr:dihydrofolate reductase family protein [Cohnella silvisoli]MCD9025242.1 dihydrofolate reductase family protein [Cohnella silvisoli]